MFEKDPIELSYLSITKDFSISMIDFVVGGYVCDGDGVLCCLGDKVPHHHRIPFYFVALTELTVSQLPLETLACIVIGVSQSTR